jgi:hypothetical protein
MDQDTVVIEQIDDGERLIAALKADGFDVGVALWVKPTDEEKPFLYLASSVVDDQGASAAYRRVHHILRQQLPSSLIESLDIKVIGLRDSLADDALKRVKPKVPAGQFAVQPPKRHRGMTGIWGATLGGISIDWARIYPPSQPDAAV